MLTERRRSYGRLQRQVDWVMTDVQPVNEMKTEDEPRAMRSINMVVITLVSLYSQ